MTVRSRASAPAGVAASGRQYPVDHRARAGAAALTVAGLVFLSSYAFGSFTRGPLSGWLMLAALAPLLVHAAARVTGFVRWYGGLAAACGIAVTVWLPLDVALARDSMVSMANVIGLLTVLRLVDVPLRERTYRAAFDWMSGWLRRRRVPQSTSAVALGFLLGQLLAFTVLPVVDAILNTGGDERTGHVTRWAGRGLTATILWSIAFPTVSVAIEVLGVAPLSYFVIALPLALLIAGALVVWAQRDSGDLDVPPAPPTPSPGPGTLVELAAYLVVIVAAILTLATVFPDASYMAIVAVTVVGASLGLALLQCRHQRRIAPSLPQLGTHLTGWWRGASAEIVIFTGGGVLLYSLQRADAIEPVARRVLALGAQPLGSHLVYLLFSVLVFVLFMVGIHPIVSVHVISVAIAALSAGWLSVPLLTLALMVGTVAALTPSPFSALSNLRAALASTEVARAVPENLGYGLVLLAVGNVYVVVLRLFGV